MGLRRILSESEINMKSIEPQQQQSRLSCNSCSDGYWNSSCCVHDDFRRLTFDDDDENERERDHLHEHMCMMLDAIENSLTNNETQLNLAAGTCRQRS